MKNEERAAYVSRDAIMKLLSDDEVARVSTAETAPSLAAGDEYVDLEELGRGVRTADAKAPVAMGRVIPRKAVAEATWLAVVALLARATASRSPA